MQWDAKNGLRLDPSCLNRPLQHWQGFWEPRWFRKAAERKPFVVNFCCPTRHGPKKVCSHSSWNLIISPFAACRISLTVTATRAPPFCKGFWPWCVVWQLLQQGEGTQLDRAPSSPCCTSVNPGKARQASWSDESPWSNFYNLCHNGVQYISPPQHLFRLANCFSLEVMTSTKAL